MCKLNKKRKLMLIFVLSFVFMSISLTANALDPASAPTVTEFSPADGATVTGANTVISFTVKDPDLIANTNCYIKVNGVQVNTSFQYAGYWDYDSCSGESYYVIYGYDTATISASLYLGDDVQNVEVMAQDRLGNQVTKSWSFNHPVKPVIGNLNPPNGQPTTNNSSISARITDNVQVNASSILMSVDGAMVIPDFDPASGILTYYPTLPFKDGVHTVQISASDTSGNQTTTSWSYTICTTGPTLTFADAGKTFDISSPEFNITASSNINLNTASLAAFIDGQQVPANFSYYGYWEYDSCSGTYYFIVQGYNRGKINIQSNGLKDGNHNLTLTLKDILGNTTTSNWNIVVAEKPVITVESPANGLFTNDSTPLITARITDNTAVDPVSVLMEFNNKQVPANYDQVAGVISYQVPETLADGSYPLVIKAADTSGNLALVNSLLTVRTTGPDLSFDKANQQYNIFNPTITVGVKSTAPISNTGYTVKIDDTPVTAIQAYGTDNKNATITYKPSFLSDGNHQITVSALDILGNSSTNTWTFSVAQPPVVSELQPANNTSLNTQNMLIKAVISDPNGPAIDKSSIKLSVNDVAQIPTVIDNNGNVNVSYEFYSPSRESTYKVTLTVADTLGNSKTKTWTFDVNLMGDMTLNVQACGSCHTLNQYNKWYHTRFWGDCEHCHASYDPNYCAYCHEASALAGKNCQDCHSSLQHRGITDILPVHSIDKGECNSCHSRYLTREHNRISNGGVQLDCSTCHRSNNPLVQQAITNKNKNCEACHGQIDHDTLHNVVLDTNCLSCHKNSVNQEHINNTTTAGKNYTCYTCHNSPRTDVLWTIRNNNLQCSGCHQTAHNLALSDQMPPDISLSTTFLWSQPLDASIFTGNASVPDGYTKGKVVISNRIKTTTLSQEWQFYNTNLTAKGWVLKSTVPVDGATNFVGVYEKEGRQVMILFYNSENSDLSGPTLESGYRTEVWFRN